MDFFARQAAARRDSRWLLLGFAVAVLAVVAAITTVALFLLGAAATPAVTPGQFALDNPQIAIVIALALLAVMLGASTYKSLQFLGGGGVVARALGGTRVDRNSNDPQLRRLMNVVDEMAIASGITRPEVYVLENESAINAFAAGHTPANAAIGITRGALERLERDELQGVIAHEFSHVLNGDMRLNLRLMGWLYGLMVLATIGRGILRLRLRAGGRSSRDGAAGVLAIMALAAALVVFGYLGMFLGRMLQAAVSRERERLADASAVQFTRDKDGLRDALAKIGASPLLGTLEHPEADEAAHMLFAAGRARLFDTHPPLLERIRTLDPSFTRADLARLAAEEAAAERQRRGGEPLAIEEARARAAAIMQGAVQEAARERMQVRDLVGQVGVVLPSGPAAFDPPTPAGVTARVGDTRPADVLRARSLRESLPPRFQQAADVPNEGRALILAVLLNARPDVRARQLARLERALGPQGRELVESAAQDADALQPMQRLPTVIEVFPALRRLSLADQRAFVDLVGELSQADATIDTLEFALMKLVRESLAEGLAPREPHGRWTLEQCAVEVSTVLAILAERGVSGVASEAGDPAPGPTDASRRAYAAGMRVAFPTARPKDLRAPAAWPQALDAALSRLTALQPEAKRRLVEALVATIMTDRWMEVAEAELLRTICAVLQCPLPVVLNRPVEGERDAV